MSNDILNAVQEYMINGHVSDAPFIINDYVITLERLNNGVRISATRGGQTESVVVYDGDLTNLNHEVLANRNADDQHPINAISGLRSELDSKQPVISDLEQIRTNAGKGATAVQHNELSSVAMTGSYNDLNGKPNLARVATSGSYNDLVDKPSMVLDHNNLTGRSGYNQHPMSSITGLIDNLNGKQGVIADLSEIRANARKADTAVQPSDLAMVATTGSYNDLTDKPTVFGNEVEVGPTPEDADLWIDTSESGSNVDPSVRWDVEQNLTDTQKERARNNIGAVNRFDTVSNSDTSGVSSAVATTRNPARPVIQITDDDGAVEAYSFWKPIMQSKGIPVCFAVPPGTISSGNPRYLSWAQVDELAALGGEIECHGNTDEFIGDLDRDAFAANLDAAIVGFRAHGYKPVEYVTHGSTFNPHMFEVVPQRFRCAERTSNSQYIKPPIMTYALGRKYFDHYTLDELKAMVDKVKTEGGWLRLAGHASYYTDGTAAALISDMIDYAISQGVEFVTAAQAMDIYGNAIETGGYDSSTMACNGTVIDCAGNTHLSENSHGDWELIAHTTLTEEQRNFGSARDVDGNGYKLSAARMIVKLPICTTNEYAVCYFYLSGSKNQNVRIPSTLSSSQTRRIDAKCWLDNGMWQMSGSSCAYSANYGQVYQRLEDEPVLQKEYPAITRWELSTAATSVYPVGTEVWVYGIRRR